MSAHAFGSGSRTLAIGIVSAAMAGIVAGAAATFAPALVWLSATAVAGGVCALVLLRFQYAVPTMFLGSLGWVLAGYAFFGRSFAYLGAPPVFIGELMLAFGLAAMFASGALRFTLASVVTWSIVAFGLCGLAGTLPYLSAYGVDALRDATLWAYGAFAIAVAGCVLRTHALPVVADRYGRWLSPFAAWLPIALAITRFLGPAVPDMPGTDVSVLSMKPGDAGVHLAGAAVFVLLGLRQSEAAGGGSAPRSSKVFWTLWFVSLLFVAALTRGGFLAVAVALVLTGLLEPLAVGRRLTAALIVLLIAAAVLLPISLTLEDGTRTAESSEDRAVTPRQVVENLLSITGRQSEARGNLSSTREWRLDWWTSIVNYTLFGPYFWSGRGFGVNLADEDGFQVAHEGDAPLRSPHNVYMTVLARMGVPGTALWLLFQICFVLSLVYGFLRARLAGAVWWARIQLWLLAYWCAFLVNASFDVFIEGPQGGIWFWCITGLGIAAATGSSRHLRSMHAWRVAG